MTLARKIALRNLALLVGLFLVGAVSLAGLLALLNQIRFVTKEYAELRMIEDTVYHASAAKAAVLTDDPDGTDASRELGGAMAALETFQRHHLPPQDEAVHDRSERARVAFALERFDAMRKGLKTDGPPRTMADATAWARDVDAVLGQINVLAHETDELVNQTQQQAGKLVRLALVAVAGLFGLIVIGSIWINVMQYRAVVVPLHRLRDGVRRIAAQQFTQRIEPAGDREFTDLAADFNRMAEELDGLYGELERKVALKSRELVASERLASVGFLAAGVAHEINNPLNIISGFAELSLKRLAASGDVDPDTLRTLQVIRDEAFRCKQITQRLLSLARPGGGQRTAVSLAGVARDVADMVQGHQASKGRRLDVDIYENGLVVCGDESELKQVVLNLTLNALQAVDPHTGVVRISGRQEGNTVELRVEDNGRGMSQSTLQHVFEPFYTVRPGSRPPGVGLGLSISHAIIDSHGGSIHAESDGIGAGSRFILRLPAFGAGEAGLGAEASGSPASARLQESI